MIWAIAPGMASIVTAISDVPDACFIEMPPNWMKRGTMRKPPPTPT